jgi:hypothetical protein
MAPACQPGVFRFERDTFTFANELIWQYRFDPRTGAMSVSRNNPPPTYSHRCFVVVRGARQFFYHARFDATQPRLAKDEYRPLIHKIVTRNPRVVSPPERRILFPGYECLRAFSQENEKLLKEECGGPWRSYFLRSHWRMVFPVHRWQQARVAERLRRRMLAGFSPAVHLFRFPQLTINHGILLFAFKESPTQFEFEAYDPNITANPVKLTYDRPARTFLFPASVYWGGGQLNLIEIFRGGLY